MKTEGELLIELGKIDANPFQVRLQEDPAAVQEVAASIGKIGLMQVPTARKIGDRYQLAFGHTRLAAFRLLASQTPDADGRIYEHMPLIIRELTDLEMFELTVSENIKRRDLNPIELARAMRQYMDPPFGKTSEEAGEFFSVSAETVRGTVRLLKLPEPVQDQVKSGAMTIGTARKFLTALHIDAAAVKKVQGAIVKLEEPTKEAVENELDEALQHSKSAVEMWQDGHEGEPRGGEDLWPLPWQHNGRLAPLTAAELMAALGAHKKVSNALMPNLLNLGQELAAGTVIDPARYSEFTAEGLERAAHLTNPPSCLACPFYTKLQESHYCGMKDCWERKVACWLQLELIRLSVKLEIPVYDPATDGEHFTVFDDRYSDLGRSWYAALQHKNAPEHTGLRLAVHQSRYMGDQPGTDHSQIAVIDVANGIHKPKRGASSSAETGEQRKQQHRKQNIKLSEEFIRIVAAPAFVSAVIGIRCLPVLQALAEDARSSDFKGMTEAAKRKFLQTQVVVGLFTKAGYQILPWASPWSDNVWSRGPMAIAKHLQSTAKEWDVKLPGDWMQKANAMMPKLEPKRQKHGITEGVKSISKKARAK